MSQIFLVIQSVNPFCLWALMIAIYESVAICQFVNFVLLEKGLIPVGGEVPFTLVKYNPFVRAAHICDGLCPTDIL